MWGDSESPGQNLSENRNPEKNNGSQKTAELHAPRSIKLEGKSIFQKQRKTIVFYRQNLREFN